MLHPFLGSSATRKPVGDSSVSFDTMFDLLLVIRRFDKEIESLALVVDILLALLSFLLLRGPASSSIGT